MRVGRHQGDHVANASFNLNQRRIPHLGHQILRVLDAPHAVLSVESKPHPLEIKVVGVILLTPGREGRGLGGDPKGRGLAPV